MCRRWELQLSWGWMAPLASLLKKSLVHHRRRFPLAPHPLPSLPDCRPAQSNRPRERAAAGACRGRGRHGISWMQPKQRHTLHFHLLLNCKFKLHQKYMVHGTGFHKESNRPPGYFSFFSSQSNLKDIATSTPFISEERCKQVIYLY